MNITARVVHGKAARGSPPPEPVAGDRLLEVSTMVVRRDILLEQEEDIIIERPLGPADQIFFEVEHDMIRVLSSQSVSLNSVNSQ